MWPRCCSPNQWRLPMLGMALAAWATENDAVSMGASFSKGFIGSGVMALVGEMIPRKNKAMLLR